MHVEIYQRNVVTLVLLWLISMEEINYYSYVWSIWSKSETQILLFSFSYVLLSFQVYFPVLESNPACHCVVCRESTSTPMKTNLDTVSPVSEPAAFEEDVAATDCLYLARLGAPVGEREEEANRDLQQLPVQRPRCLKTYGSYYGGVKGISEGRKLLWVLILFSVCWSSWIHGKYKEIQHIYCRPMLSVYSFIALAFLDRLH